MLDPWERLKILVVHHSNSVIALFHNQLLLSKYISLLCRQTAKATSFLLPPVTSMKTTYHFLSLLEGCWERQFMRYVRTYSACCKEMQYNNLHVMNRIVSIRVCDSLPVCELALAVTAVTPLFPSCKGATKLMLKILWKTLIAVLKLGMMYWLVWAHAVSAITLKG